MDSIHPRSHKPDKLRLHAPRNKTIEKPQIYNTVESLFGGSWPFANYCILFFFLFSLTMKLDAIDHFPEHEYETDAQGSQKSLCAKS